MALTFLATYDIENDNRRARIAATLQRWGDRIQYSVFICTLEADQLAELMAKVQDIMDPSIDSFIVLRQCATCWEHRTVLGQAQPPEPVLYWAAL
jgi:CRISPR-associated protein Cas2